MRHLRHHGRFYVALMVGVLGFLLGGALGGAVRILLAGVLFFGTYLGLMLRFAFWVTTARLRARAAIEDEGAPLIFCLTAVAVSFGLGATYFLVNDPKQNVILPLLAVASVPLSWAMVHTLAALHYAKLYYAPKVTATGSQDSGGLLFPGTKEPAMIDFLYYSFVIGMTAQVSDVNITARAQRRAALLHGVISFFYNTVLIALLVNAAVSLAS